MKLFTKSIWLIMLFSLTGTAFAQVSQIYFKQVDIALSTGGAEGESVVIRGVVHNGKKIALRLKGIESIANGGQVKSDCVKFASVTSLDSRAALEVYVLGTSVVNGTLDDWKYTQATVTLASTGMAVNCGIVNTAKYDYAATSVSWHGF